MKRVELAFGSNPWVVASGRASGAVGRMAAATFLLLCLAALVLTGLRSATLSRAVAGAASAGPALPPARIAQNPANALRLAALSRSVRHLNTPWATILDELERHASAEVALLAIDADATAGRMRMELEARHLKSLVDFAQHLGTSSSVERVTLGKHESVDREPGKPVRMSLEVKLLSSADRAAAGGPP